MTPWHYWCYAALPTTKQQRTPCWKHLNSSKKLTTNISRQNDSLESWTSTHSEQDQHMMSTMTWTESDSKKSHTELQDMGLLVKSKCLISKKCFDSVSNRHLLLLFVCFVDASRWLLALRVVDRACYHYFCVIFWFKRPCSLLSAIQAAFKKRVICWGANIVFWWGYQ